MDEREFMQQLFLLKSDIEACPMLDSFAAETAEQRNRWAARLGDLMQRRNDTSKPLHPSPCCGVESRTIRSESSN